MRSAAVLTLALALGGCLMPRYLGQAASGQLMLLTRGRPIQKVIDDPDVPIAIRELLAEVPAIKEFAGKKGLTITRNYDKYVDLGRDYVVYFVGAAPRLSFEARKWCFPIAGCFTGLGWFDEQAAVEFRDELEAAGWDAFARPASAYSTGGWFPDPLLSSMLPDGDPRTPDEATGFADLANVFLHESVHATIFVPDEPHFNEGIAEFIGDRLADELLVERFGEGSAEVLAYREELAWREGRFEREMEAYDALEKVYAGKASDADKLAQKQKIIDGLVEDLGLRRRPNNASLVEIRVYLASYEGFARVHAACGSTERLIAAGKTIRRGDFEKEVQEDLAPVLAKMEAACRKNKSSEKVARGS
jgi:predicted aminopeptidase